MPKDIDRENLPKSATQKLEGIFVDPQIREVIKAKSFDGVTSGNTLFSLGAKYVMSFMLSARCY